MSDDLHSRLRPFIGDHATDGADTVLVLQGFRDRAEIEEFMDTMLEAGVFRSKKLKDA